MHDHVKTNAENRPGVYQMIAADGEVVYVGKSKTIRPCSRCHDPEDKAPKWQADHIGVPKFAVVEAGIKRAVADFIERGTGNALVQFHFKQRVPRQRGIHELTDAGQVRVAKCANARLASQFALK